VRNGFWIVSDSIFTAVISLLTVLVMARLVSPEDFGIAAIVNGVTLLLNLYVEGLFHDALIQNRNAEEREYGYALWFVETVACVLVGSVMLAALVLPAEQARFAWLGVGSLAALPFSGFVGVANSRERRGLSYRRIALASIVGRTLGCGIGIALALLGWGVWSLIIQLTSGYAIQALLLLAQVRWLPRPRLSLEALRESLRFALPYALMHTISGLRLQVFTLLVAVFSSLTAAGYLNVAFRLTITPQTAINTTLMNFGFPLLAASRTSREALQRQFERVTKIACVTAVPAFVGMALVAPQLVPLAFGPGWERVVVPVQILALAAAAGFMRISGSFLARVEGHVRYSLFNAVFQLAFVTLFMAVLQPQDELVAVLIWSAPILVVVPATAWLVGRLSALSLKNQFLMFLPSLLGLLVMAGAVKLFDLYPGLPAAADFLGRVVAGAIAFTAVVLLFDTSLRQDVLHAARHRPA
jgi:O-antigen/teichoic acid export membrane protein